MSGNTLGSISRNCINGDFGFIAITGKKAVPRTDADGSKYLELGDKKIYYCGSDNAASFKKIRGLTIGGWYADEINLHDWDFIETAEARSFAALDRFQIWTLNPSAPGHRIYKERLDVYQENKTEGYNWFHFTLDDNPALTEDRKKQIAQQYKGVFYQRYVLGQRVKAEGACYPSFSAANIWQSIPDNVKIKFAYLGVDICGNKSATAFALTGLWFGPTHDGSRHRWHAVLLDELYDTENKSTEAVLEKFTNFVRQSKEQYTLNTAFVDSAEQLIKKSMSNLGIINVENSKKKPVVDRVRFLDLMFSQRRFYVMAHCKNTIEALQSASWNDKSDKEERLDDGSSNIDSLDAFEYSWEGDMRSFIL